MAMRGFAALAACLVIALANLGTSAFGQSASDIPSPESALGFPVGADFELAGAQHTIELAYQLLSQRNDPTIAAIRDQVVLLLWPSLNPDGQDLVVEWYRSNLGTPYEVAPI